MFVKEKSSKFNGHGKADEDGPKTKSQRRQGSVGDAEAECFCI